LRRPLSYLSPPFLRVHRQTCTISFPENRLESKSKKLRQDQDMSETNNISFDSDSNEERENIDPSSHAFQSRRLMSGSLQILGNLMNKNNEHLLNAIMRQANHQNLMDTLGYPNCTVWIKDNIPLWFGTGGILAG
jgi:hypothetical protein